VVVVDGSVTTPSAAFESSFFDKGFGLQDRSAGIYVSLPQDLGIAGALNVEPRPRSVCAFGRGSWTAISLPNSAADRPRSRRRSAIPGIRRPRRAACGARGTTTYPYLARLDSAVKVPTGGAARTSRYPVRRVLVRSLCAGPGVHFDN